MIRLPKLVSVGVLIVMLGGVLLSRPLWLIQVALSYSLSQVTRRVSDIEQRLEVGIFSKGNNDTLSSVKNHTNWSAAFWYDAHQRGHCWDYSPKTDDPYFWWYDDNQASSFALGRGC